MIKLSNGTLINRVQLGTGVIEATVSPLGRPLTDEEWAEYVPIVSESNIKHHRYSQLMRMVAMRENPFKYYIPDDWPSTEAMQAEMKEIESYFEQIEAE